jgi:dihydropteroate synthase
LRNRPRYINAGGRLLDLEVPKVMGIINVTTDSFYSGSRFFTDNEILSASGKMISEEADILDIGGCSSRPGAFAVPASEEMERTMRALRLIRKEYPEAILSVDTSRSEIAAEAVEKYGVNFINDISGGKADGKMFKVVERLNVPYILMHMKGDPATMQDNPEYDDIIADILKFFAERIFSLRTAGVKDIVIDPGFGFGKTLNHNFELMGRLDDLGIAGMPILVGISRKSMIWRTLGITPDKALNGTTALHAAALLKGADILRVHDVKEAVQTIRLISKLKN